MEHGTVSDRVAGTPQGGVISPLLCNVYLNQLDQVWADHNRSVLVRCADDLVVMCRSRGEAEHALATLRRLLGGLGLEPKESKTRIVHLEVGGESFNFLGFEHRLISGRGWWSHVKFLARWPSRRARDRIRELTDRSRIAVDLAVIVEDLNRFLRGWVAYFRYRNSAWVFDKIRTYTVMRLALPISYRHSRARSYGWAMMLSWPDTLGLFEPDGSVAPRPHNPWRARPNATR